MKRNSRLWLKTLVLMLGAGMLFQGAGCSSNYIMYQVAMYALQALLSGALSGSGSTST